MSKYRFKTEKEFIRDGLWDEEHNCPDEWAWEGQMNKYLGKDVPEEFNTDCDKNSGFDYNDWIFSKNDYVLKEQQEYFDDLSQHIGRYIKALVDYPHAGGVKKGEIGRIINKHDVNFPSQKRYSCSNALSKGVLGVEYELLPEDYSPEQEPNVEFIPGKWYNFTTMEGKYNLYVKASSITGRKLFFMNGESISDGYFGKADCIDIKLIENPRLVEDLSEIQDFLPDEHPDKVKNFKLEVGKWYSFNWDYFGKDQIVIAKIKKVEEDQFSISWRSYLWLDKSYSDNDAYSFKCISNIKELSIKEIQPYLPKEHPDKIFDKVEYGEFKKGEYIVLIDKGQSTGSAALLEVYSTFIQNHCYKVRETKEYLLVELDSVGSTTNGWACIPYNPNEYHKNRNWRYATQEEIDEYEKRGKPYDVTELQKKELSMKDIQEECKKRFPIGCTYISTDKITHILKGDSYTYCIIGQTIWAHSGGGLLYENGKWVELVSLPEQDNLKEEAIKYSEKTNAIILLASDIKSKELYSTYEEPLLSTKLLSNKITSLINNVGVVSSVNLKIK